MHACTLRTMHLGQAMHPNQQQMRPYRRERIGDRHGYDAANSAPYGFNCSVRQHGTP